MTASGTANTNHNHTWFPDTHFYPHPLWPASPHALLKDPVGALRLPGAARGAMPPDEPLLLLPPALLLPLLPAPLRPRSPVVLREPGLDPPVGWSIQLRTSDCALLARPTSSTR